MRRFCLNLVALFLLAITLTLSVQASIILAAQHETIIDQTVPCIPDPYSDNPLENIKISSSGMLKPQSSTIVNQPLYQAILAALQNLNDEINVASYINLANSEEIFATREKVLDDHPEIFYFKHNTSPYYTNGRLVFGYQYDKAAIPQMKTALIAKADSIIQQCIIAEDSSWQKEKAIHDYLILHAAYDYQNYLNNTVPYESFNAYGILMNGTGVCSGYAKAMKLLLDHIQLECILISGDAGGPHMWNMVKIDDQWYHLDAAWDDPVPDTPGQFRHSYFNIPDIRISANHTLTTTDYPTASSDRFVYLQDMVHPVLYNGYYYYASNTDSIKLYKCAADGSNLQKLYDVRAQYLAIYKDWIYFSNYSYGAYLFKIKIDGTSLCGLNTMSSKNIAIQNGWLNYTDESGQQNYTLCIDQNQQPIITMDGTIVTSLSPVIKNGNILLPLASITTLFGLQSTTTGEEIQLQQGSTVLTLQLDSTHYHINGQDSSEILPAAPQTINNQTMLPLASIASSFGYAVYTKMPKYLDILSPGSTQLYLNAFCVHNPDQDYQPANLSAISYGWIKLVSQEGQTALYLDPYDFPPTYANLLQQAKQSDTRRLISIWCTDHTIYDTELDKTELSGQLSDFLWGNTSVAGINVSDYTGVVIDFENFPSETNPTVFRNWLSKVSTILHAKGLSLSVCLPMPLYQGSKFDYPGISQYADEIILMAHNYATPTTQPRTDSPLDLISTDIQTLKNQSVPSNKILLQLSLQNAQYVKNSEGSWNYLASPSLRTIRNAIADIESKERAGQILQHDYDPDTASNILVFERTEENGVIKTYTIYYVDEKGLAARLNLIRQQGLKGLSLWELGYNGPNPDAWAAIHFQAPRLTWQNLNPVSSDASLSNLQINGQSLPGFSPGITSYTIDLPEGSSLPTITANKNHCQAGEPTINISLTSPGVTTIQVTAEDGSKQTYTLNFRDASQPSDECFIATAAFGSKFEPAVVLLRHFRDQYLLSNRPGTAFVKLYYHYSPPIATIIAQSKALKIGVRFLLTPIIAIVYVIYHPFVIFIIILAGIITYLLKKANHIYGC